MITYDLCYMFFVLMAYDVVLCFTMLYNVRLCFLMLYDVALCSNMFDHVRFCLLSLYMYIYIYTLLYGYIHISNMYLHTSMEKNWKKNRNQLIKSTRMCWNQTQRWCTSLAGSGSPSWVQWVHVQTPNCNPSGTRWAMG